MVVVVGIFGDVGTESVLLADGVIPPVPPDPDPAATAADAEAFADAVGGGGDLAVPVLPSTDALRTPPLVEPKEDIEPLRSAALVTLLVPAAPFALGVAPLALGVVTSIGEEEDEPVVVLGLDGPSERVERDVVFDSFVDASESARSDADSSFDRVRPIFFEGV